MSVSHCPGLAAGPANANKSYTVDYVQTGFPYAAERGDIQSLAQLDNIIRCKVALETDPHSSMQCADTR